MRYLVGLPSYKNLGEALESVLARHLAAHRKRQTETARAALILASQTGEPPNVLPKNVAALVRPNERSAWLNTNTWWPCASKAFHKPPSLNIKGSAMRPFRAG